MSGDAPPRSWRRARWAWTLFRAGRAEAKGQFDRAIRLLDDAAAIKALWPPEKVQRALLLLRSQRIAEAQRAFCGLRDEFKGSEDPDVQYLRHFCTSMLSDLQGFSHSNYEAKRAKKIECSNDLKRRFPMFTTDELWDRVQPRS